ncbi:MAG: polyprenyl synthetase family protein [Planctomycetes bacterium]|nr:polyprenyl synthetase family protein [Planctomycetota bacterium]
MSDFAEVLRSWKPRLETWLDEVLPSASTEPQRLHEAMRYSVFGGGKRLRGALVVLSAQVFDAAPEVAREPACAVELVHTYSLIHDDLPCMDDDDLRRGRPTAHKVYGEALALLAGDALLTRGLALLAEAQRAEAVGLMVRELGAAAGSVGMVGGQVLDLESEGRPIDRDAHTVLRRIHLGKTAAMIRASAALGGLAAGAGPEAVAALRSYGEHVGLAFQIADDVLDETGTAEELGKTPGKDRDQGKLTYVAALGLEGARLAAREEVERAIAALKPLGNGANGRLAELARFAVERTS